MPRWVPVAILIFWGGFIATLVLRWTFSKLAGLLLLLLVSLFFSLAIEPGVNRLALRGWRRGRATLLMLLIVLLGAALFVTAISTLVGRQVADLLQNTDKYVTRIVNFVNDIGRDQPRSARGERTDPGSRRRVPEVHRVAARRRAAAVVHRAGRAAPGVLGVAVHLLSRGRRTQAASGDLQPAAAEPPAAGVARVGTGDHQDRRLPVLACAARRAVGVLPLGRVHRSSACLRPWRSPCGSGSSRSSSPWSAPTSLVSCRSW